MTDESGIAQQPKPVQSDERIESIDVLRGVAVLGIFALNISAFAMPGSAYMNPTAYGDFTGINYWTWYFVHLFGDLKFWTIFSMLFGAGILIMTERCEKTGRKPLGIHYRRMGILALFGILHAHLLWFGDILYTYAMCGFVLYFFRKLAPSILFILGIGLMSVAFFISLAFGMLLASGVAPEMNEELAVSWSPTDAVIEQQLDTYRGGYLTHLPVRSSEAFVFETFLFLINFGWRSGGLILIGMGFHKLGVFSAERSDRFYAILVALALLVGLPVIAFGVYMNDLQEWSLEYSFFFGPLPNYWASVLISLGWVGCVMLICKRPSLKPLTQPFAAAGRMALSCYLLQSIVATTVFYGHGLGWFGYLDRWQLMLFVIAVWVGELIFASIWLSMFRYGPFEWIWRSMTYWKLQPMKKRLAENQ